MEINPTQHLPGKKLFLAGHLPPLVRKWAFILIGILFTSLYSFGSITITGTGTSTGTLDYGAGFTISEIIIEEGVSSDFSNGYYTITLTAPDGFQFVDMDNPIKSTGDITTNLSKPSPISGETTLNISFSTYSTSYEDKVTLHNIELEPKEESDSYGGDFTVSLFLSGITDPIATKSFGPYDMVQPEIVYSTLEKGCLNQQYNFSINVNNGGTLTNNDKIEVTYIHKTNNTLDKTLINNEGLGTLPKDITIDTLKADYNKIITKITFDSEWELSNELNLGKSASNDITIGDTASINFTDTNVVVVQLYEGNVALSKYIVDTSGCSFEAEKGNYLLKKNNETYFRAGTALTGTHKITIRRAHPVSNCETVDTLYIIVVPDMITAKDVYCYGVDNNDKIKIAVSALNSIFPESGLNIGDSIYFYKIDIIGNGWPLYEAYKEDKSLSSSDEFYEFDILPTNLYDRSQDSSGSVNILIDVYALVRYYIYRYNYYYNRTSPISSDNCNCYQISSSPPRWNCLCWYKTTRTNELKIASKISKIAMPKKDGEVTDMSNVYCWALDSIRLRGNNTIQSITSSSWPSGIINRKGEYYLDLKSFPSNKNTTFNVKYSYYDENACPGDTTYTPTVYAVPEVDFLAEAICEGNDQEFTQVSPDSAWVNIKGWNWNFGDEYTVSNLNDTSIVDIPNNLTTTTGTYKSPAHKYRTPGKKAVTLGVMSEQGCTNSSTDTIVIGKYPSPKFTFHGKLQDNPITLTNLSGIFPDDSVNEYRYTIIAPSGTTWNYRLSNRNQASFIPDEFGVYQINLRATSGNKCMGYADTLIPVFPIERVTNESHYFQDFTQSQSLTGWLPSYSYIKGEEESWKQIPVSGHFNDNDKHKEGNMWLTGDPTDSVDNEASWLESPCFEIKDLDFPMISMDIFQSVEAGRDGAAVFYSIDDGDTWKRLGSKETGANWYNTEGIFSNPGNTMGKNTWFQGWSKDTSAWVIARHPLELVRNEMQDGSCVRFRVAYNSNDYHDSIYAGFAMDNFLIGKRKRVVLLEQFINSTYEDEVSSSPVDFDKLNSFVDSNAVEVVDIRYHMATNEYEDPLYRTFNNSQDIISRATEYGADAFGPMWAMDGSAIRSVVWGTPVNIDYNEAFLKRALVDPAFEIDSVYPKLDGNSLHISARIRKVSAHLDEKLGIHDHMVRFAIVQKSYTDNQGRIHRNVLVDLLPNGVGNVAAILSAPFDVGKSVTVTETWSPSIKTAGNAYRLIIYVQGRYNYDQIEQVQFRDLTTDEVPQLSTKLDQAPISGNNLKVYPNPVRQQLYVFIPQNFGKNMKWEVYSMNGQLVHSGLFIDSNGQETVHVDRLKEGVYVLKISNDEGIQLVTKFSKIY